MRTTWILVLSMLGSRMRISWRFEGLPRSPSTRILETIIHSGEKIKFGRLLPWIYLSIINGLRNFIKHSRFSSAFQINTSKLVKKSWLRLVFSNPLLGVCMEIGWNTLPRVWCITLKRSQFAFCFVEVLLFFPLGCSSSSWCHLATDDVAVSMAFQWSTASSFDVDPITTFPINLFFPLSEKCFICRSTAILCRMRNGMAKLNASFHTGETSCFFTSVFRFFSFLSPIFM